MRLLVDGQCLQSTSSLRGIGRYGLNLLEALVETAQDHQVEVLLAAGGDGDRLLRARAALETFLPPRALHVYDAPWPWDAPPEPVRRRAAEAVYAAAVRSLTPDALLVLSVFEGDPENVQTVDAGVPTAAVLYDLIPAADPGTYLLGPAAPEYWRRFEELARCDLLLSISDYSAAQAHTLLRERCPRTATIWGGPFPPGRFPTFEEDRDALPELHVPDRFVLTVGGDHPRKNLDRLVRAWARVPAPTRAGTSLIVACGLSPGTLRRLQRVARRAGLAPEELVLTGRVSDRRLGMLYERALGFIFPSTEEGLGMPPIEAMAAGCPTLLASSSSLVELTDEPEAFFDGESEADMARALQRLLTDERLRLRLRRAAEVSTTRLTWEAAARRSWAALEQLPRVAFSDAPALVAPPAPAAPRGTSRTELRRALAALPAVSISAAAAPDLLRAGIVDLPLLLPGEQAAAGRHDLANALRPHLAGLSLRDDQWEDLVTALLPPIRWSLQRPAPAWLLVLDAGLSPDHSLERAVAAAGAVLVTAGPDELALAESCDAVAVAAGSSCLPLLGRARARGTVVLAVGDGDVPTWCRRVASLQDVPEALARLGRTVGWPWQRDA